LPTLLELANVSAASVQFGLSLVPFLQDERTPFATHDFVFSEGGYSNFNEYEPNDPAQVHVYSDPKNFEYPRGRQVLSVCVCVCVCVCCVCVCVCICGRASCGVFTFFLS
jgi:hypothetical protein